MRAIKTDDDVSRFKAGGKPSTWFPPGGTRRAGCFTLNFFIDHTHNHGEDLADESSFPKTYFLSLCFQVSFGIPVLRNPTLAAPQNTHPD